MEKVYISTHSMLFEQSGNGAVDDAKAPGVPESMRNGNEWLMMAFRKITSSTSTYNGTHATRQFWPRLAKKIDNQFYPKLLSWETFA